MKYFSRAAVYLYLVGFAPHTQAQETSAFESSFSALSEEQRMDIQEELSRFGAYPGIIDGRWGAQTAAALLTSYTIYWSEWDLEYREGEEDFLQMILLPYDFWGEGDECDGCDEVAEQAIEMESSGGISVILPHFVTRSKQEIDSDVAFTVDLTRYCSDGHQVREQVMATYVKGASIGLSICSNVNELASIGYQCSIRIAMGGSHLGYGKMETISDFSLSFDPELVACENRSSAATVDILSSKTGAPPSLSLFKGIPPLKLSPYDADLILGDGSRTPNRLRVHDAPVVTFVESNLDKYLSFVVSSIDFSCEALNSCTVSGETLSQEIVNSIPSIGKMTIQTGTQVNFAGMPSFYRYSIGVTKFGEIIEVDYLSDIGRGLKISRGEFDKFRPGGISLK